MAKTKAHSLAGLFSQAVQDGLRKGVGDIALQVSQNARKKMLTTGSEAIGGFLSGGGVGDDGQIDPATGAPAWFANVLKANFNTYLIIGQRGSGKCLAEGSLVLDAGTGALIPVEQAATLTATTSLSNDWKVVPSYRHAWVDRGIQPGYRVTLRSGREIVTTAEHPFRKY